MRNYDSICCFRSKESDEVRLLWELTTFCNLDCKFCHKTNALKIGLSLGEISRIIPKLKLLGVTEIIISGGEPLIRNDLFDILYLLKESNFSLDICTNGYLIDDNIARKLSNYFKEISVSIDSISGDVHNSMRNKSDALERSLTGINHLIKYGVDVHVTTLVNAQSIFNLQESIKELYEKGVRSIALIGEIPTHGGEYYVQNPEVQLKIHEILSTLRTTHKDLSLNTKEIFNDRGYTTCPAGKSVLSLDVNGFLSPCILLRSASRIELINSEASDIFKFIEKCKKGFDNVFLNDQVSKGICPGSKSIYLNGLEEN